MNIAWNLLDHTFAWARTRWAARRRGDAGDVLGETIVIGIVVAIAIALGVVLWNVYNKYAADIK